ncbi:MAG: hypothetical protein ABW065_02385 [Solirubrobacterales bacterium]
MADSNPMHRGSCDPSSPEAEDRRTESAVLVNLLAEHPTPLTEDELILLLHADPERGDPGGAGQNAIRELVAAGLVHRNGRFFSLTRPAVYFARLDVS